MVMTLAELSDHTGNIENLLAIKRHQLRCMKIDTVARARHEAVITALESRVAELRRATDQLRGDLPALQLGCVRPGVPPEIRVGLQPEALGDLPATAHDLRT